MPGVSRDILDRTQGAAMTALGPEYNRRVAVYGKSQADQWMNGAAQSVGRETGALAPEYRRRIQEQGRDNADRWYVSQARDISRRYVANSNR